MQVLPFARLQDVKYFKVPDKRVQVNVRLRASLKAQIDGLTRVWKVVAEREGIDPKDITFSYAAERLLESGIDAAWVEIGELAGLKGMPSSEDEWKTLESAVRKRARQ